MWPNKATSGPIIKTEALVTGKIGTESKLEVRMGKGSKVGYKSEP